MISSSFDEIEDETTLRVLYNFSVSDSNGNLISFDDIGTGKPPARLKGTLVEPLPHLFKEKMLEFLSSSPGVECIDEAAPVATQQPIEPISRDVPELDWSSLNISSLVDGYCTKTMKWYEGKIMDIAKIVTESNPHGEATSFKVHFKGWNAKHDEWIDQGSRRLRPLGSMTQQPTSTTSSDSVHPTSRRCFIPWYENTAIYQKVYATPTPFLHTSLTYPLGHMLPRWGVVQLEELAGKIPKRNTVEIDISTIDDWYGVCQACVRHL